MVECTFELNGKPMSLLKMGAIHLPAFSGLGSHVNQREFICTPNAGPIPPGTYYILDRQSGGRLGALRDLLRDRSEWFALYAADGKIDDEVFCNKVKRGNFRLHPNRVGGVSQGCITLANLADFNKLRFHVKASKQVDIPGSTLKAYGRIVVK
ncbi:DUF2778 domain-containing protein [Massilia timonae]|uniref:DUF2778 domain-containing protein n=1 Tax=Massilia timonae TaxID=47229 RepID=UPI002357EA6C|nr:DUF2778 domain-containing protein [Massilia timonae]